MQRLSLSLLVVSALGCAAAKPKPLQLHPAGEPDLEWLAPPAEAKDSFAREAGDHGEWQAQSKDGRYSVTGYNFGPESHSISFIKETGGPNRIELDLLADDPMNCKLEEARIEAAARMEKLLEAVKQQGELRAAAAVGVRAVGGYPLLFADALYAKKVGNDTTVGERKLAVFTRPGFTLTCEHDGPGLRGAFERGVRLMAETLRDTRNQPPPPRRFGQILTRRLNGKLLGYGVEELAAPSADGTYRRDYREVELVPSQQAPGFTGIDSVRVEKRAADGKLMQGSYAVVRAGRLTATLTAQADGSLALEGTSPEPFTGKLQTADQLRLHPAADMLALAQGKRETIDDESFDPARPQKVIKYTLRSAKDGRFVIIEGEGNPLARAEVDEQGAIVGLTSTDGTYQARQLWIEGRLP